MSATVLYMSMSLDGFIADPSEDPTRLHEWLSGESSGAAGVPGKPSGANGQVVDEFMATGAVVAGRGTFEPAGGWDGDHHDGVPIFILSRREPGIDVEQWPLVTYVNDVGTAMTEAKRAAGDRNVLVHGAAVAQLALAAGLLDEPESASPTSTTGSSAELVRHHVLIPAGEVLAPPGEHAGHDGER